MDRNAHPWYLGHNYPLAPLCGPCADPASGVASGELGGFGTAQALTTRYSRTPDAKRPRDRKEPGPLLKTLRGGHE